MSRRLGPPQPDLFARTPAAAPSPAPGPDPLDELTALLETLRAADRLPWPHVTVAMEEERRVLFLAGRCLAATAIAREIAPLSSVP